MRSGLTATSVSLLLIAYSVIFVDAQRNLYLNAYYVGFQYTSTPDGIFLTAASSNATSDVRSDDISGSNLWLSELFASRQSDGYGLRRIINQQLLNSQQSSRRLLPGGTLRFTTPVNVNLKSLQTFPYLCIKLSKHPQAFPNYQFRAGTNRFIQLCRSIRQGTQSLQNQQRQSNEVDFISYGVNYQYEFQMVPSMRQPIVYINEVQAHAVVSPLSRSARGNNIMQLKLFLAQNADGHGLRLLLSNQLLDRNQASGTLNPGQSVTLTSNRRFNIGNYGPGTDYPYLCTEFTSVPGSGVQFTFGDRSAVSCRLIKNAPTQDESQAEVEYQTAHVSFSRPNPRTNEARADVLYIVRFGDSVPIVDGNALWQLSMFASQEEGGSGTRRVISQQMLDSNQMSVGLRSGREMRFTTTERFDVLGLGQDYGLPYVCLEFSKHPQSPVNIVYQGVDVITTCDLVPEDILLPVEEVPHAVAQSYDLRIQLHRGSHLDTNVDANVIYYVTFDPTSDVIEGGSPLWQLRFFISEQRDGSGQRAEISSQILDQNQMSAGVNPGDYIRFSGSERFDFTELRQDLPYICVSLEKNPLAEFELEFRDSDAVVACKELPAFTNQTQARVDFRAAKMSFLRPDLRTNEALANVRYVIRFGDSNPSVDGNALWQLSMFASQNNNGTGTRRLISQQILDSNQIAVALRPNREIQFTASERFDVEGLGQEYGVPYMCLAFSKHPQSPIDVIYQGEDIIVTCEIIPSDVLVQVDEIPRVMATLR